MVDIVNEIKMPLKEAFYLFLGGYAASFIRSLLSKFSFGQNYGTELTFAGSVVLAYIVPSKWSMVDKVAKGAAIYSAIALMEKYVSPLMAKVGLSK